VESQSNGEVGERKRKILAFNDSYRRWVLENAMIVEWDYYVSTIIADQNERSKTADKLEKMMRRQGVAGWELVNVIPFGTNLLYAIYKKPR